MQTHSWFLIGLFSLAVTGRAETTEERLNRLEQEIRELKQQRELEQQQATKPRDVAVATAGADGFAIKSADGAFQLRLRGQVQLDGRYYLESGTNAFTDTFLVRRARPIIEGTLYKQFDFRLVPDFGSGTTTIQDAYLEWTYWPALRLRGGKFKPPVGLERLQSDADSWFVEPGLSTALVPNRDVGVQIGGELFGGTVSYAVGVFHGVADGASGDLDGTGEGKEFAARVFAHPFKKTELAALRGLGLGVAVTYGDQQGTAATPGLPTYKTAGQVFFSRLQLVF